MVMAESKMTCCCCSLRTGCLVIGYLSAVLHAIGAGYCIFGAIALSYSVNEDSKALEIVMPKLFLNIGVVQLMVLAITCLLLFGVHKGRPSFILPWILTTAAGLVIQYTSLTQLAVTFGSLGTLADWGGASVAILLFFAFQLYLLLVVIIYYHNMKKPSRLEEDEEFMM